jgi:hypothetical protein
VTALRRLDLFLTRSKSADFKSQTPFRRSD